jgi:aldehyde dehydrogenase (NAD+)
MRMATELQRLFVGGEFVDAHSDRPIDLISPVTEQPFAAVADADDVDVASAASAARRAAPQWAATSPAERGEYLGALADLLEKRVDEMASLVTRENGSVITRSRSSNGTLPVGVYRRYAKLARSFAAEEIFGDEATTHSLVRHEPLGVAGLIIPWNAPQVLLANKLAPALLAGCTVVIKPSPETSLDALFLAEMLAEIGLPPGVANVVTGGRETGAALVREPNIDKISFTGSTVAGRIIAAQCGEMLKPMTAELGGKSAAVVLDDADLELFARNLITTCLPNTGQVCYSCTRILAPRSNFDAVLDVVRETLRNAPIGDPTDPRTEFGPLVSSAQRARVEGYIRSGLDEGARVVLGGGRPREFDVGYYVEPTVFIDVQPEMKIFREEIFGPVVVVVPYDDDDDAVRVANDSTYGLGGSVFATDIDRAVNVARQMQTGNILINAERGFGGAPHHGYKDSGVGGDAGLSAYLQAKSINIPRLTHG